MQNSQIILKFITSLIILFYLPGHFLLKRIKRNFPVLDWIVLSFSLGLLVVVQCYYFLGILRLEHIFFKLLIILSCIYGFFLAKKVIFRKYNKINFKPFAISKEFFVVLGMLLILLGIVYITIMTSSIMHPDGMRFYGANGYDSIAQIAFIQELIKPFPHQIPFWAGKPFLGYHIDAYYWPALVARFSGINTIILFFRLCPFFIFTLFLLTIYISIRQVFNKRIAVASVFFIIFMADLSWVFPVLDRVFSGFNIISISFMGSPLSYLLFNPPFLLALIIFFSGLYFLHLSAREDNFLVALISALFFGFIFKYKSFFGVTVSLSLLISGLITFLYKRNTNLLRIALICLGFFIVSVSSTMHFNSSSIFNFTPGYYIIYLIKELNSAFHINLPLNIFTFIAGILVFITGSLGIKLLAFVDIYGDIKNWKKLPDFKLFLITSLTLALLVTYFFTLNTNYPSGTISFYHIFIIIAALYSSALFVNFLEQKRQRIKALAIVSVFLLGLGSTLFSILAYTSKYLKYQRLKYNELAALDFIRNNTEQDAVILHNRKAVPWFSLATGKIINEGNTNRDCFISALSGRRVVLECSWHVEAGRLAPDLEKRIEDVNLFFETKDRNKAIKILDNYKVDYIWLEDYLGPFVIEDSIKEVFSGDNIRIYKVMKKSYSATQN